MTFRSPTPPVPGKPPIKIKLSAGQRHALDLIAFALAVIGALAGAGVVWMHLTSDPIGDAHAYYDAATRLNHGLPLYPANADPNSNSIYLYPPLLAIALRPFALLPYAAFATLWEAFVLASFVLLIRQLGGGRRVFLAIGFLGIPVGWALTVGQAHVPMTLLMAIGQPWSIALAANIKVFPALIALWWVGRRDYQAIIAFAIWMLLLGVAQFLLDPHGTTSYFTAVGANQIGDKRSISPYALSPALWGALVIGGALWVVSAARLRSGWAAAVIYATLASPLLLVYTLMGLLAGLRQPRQAGDPDSNPHLDVATAYSRAAR
jgi:hypothetical protein